MGKTGWRRGGRKKKEGLCDSQNSTERIVERRQSPVPLGPYRCLTELDSDSCSLRRCNASQGRERSLGTLQRLPSLSAPEQLPDFKVA